MSSIDGTLIPHSALAIQGPPPLPQGLAVIDRIRKSFGDKLALRDISFSVPSGQICGLLGPNGAGKTTLFRLLMGILKATERSVQIDGLDAFEDRVAVKRLIGFLPDEPVFYSYLSGSEVLELSAAMHGLDVPATMDRIGPIIARLRLADDIDNYAEDYSRGMKKKLGLLLAILHQRRSSSSSMSQPTAWMSNRRTSSTTSSPRPANRGRLFCSRLTSWTTLPVSVPTQSSSTKAR